MDKLNILDVVALTENLPQHKLYRGQVVNIVEDLAPSVYEVEFSDDSCINCNHTEYTDDTDYYYRRECKCPSCIETRQSIEQEKQLKTIKLIQSEYSINNQSVYLYSNLEFSDKIILLALLRLQTDEPFNYIKALDEIEYIIEKCLRMVYKAYYFDGIKSYIEVKDSLDLDIENEISICSWVNQKEQSNDQYTAGGLI